MQEQKQNRTEDKHQDERTKDDLDRTTDTKIKVQDESCTILTTYTNSNNTPSSYILYSLKSSRHIQKCFHTTMEMAWDFQAGSYISRFTLLGSTLEIPCRSNRWHM